MASKIGDKPMATLRCFSPAKLNRFLHILGRRADGYHELQTVFQLLDYADELTFTTRDDNEIKLTTTFVGQVVAQQLPDNIVRERFAHPDLQSFINESEKNLIVRAAHLLQTTMDVPQGTTIHLHKRIPIGGGLGGGSSNAATTLLALNKLWQLKLSTDELAILGLQLGADVPVFIHGKTAWAEGIGEQLTPLTLVESWFVVLIPACSVSTAEIYSANELTRNTPAITIRAFLSGHPTHNDCESVVCKRYPLIDSALGWLNQFAPARLTGTGCCIFAEFVTEDAARKVLQQAHNKFQGFIAKGINIWGVAKR
jgi:4-diphosphocytidyl-2-C-methyl-D-erythritol kinase